MEQIGNISFEDLDTHDEAVILVRAREDRIAMSVSLKEDGDVEVFLKPSDCEHLVDLLRQAIKTSQPRQ